MLDQFAAMVAKITGLIDEGDSRAAQASMDRLAAEFLELEPGKLTRLTDAQLLESILKTTPPTLVCDKVWMFALALEKAADVFGLDGDKERRDACLLTALNLTLWAERFESDGPMLEFGPKIENLVFALDGVALPVDASLNLMRRYEKTEAFAKAEDVLHCLKEERSELDILPDLGVEFYERLLAKPDSLLAEGNLPRDEVESGLREWSEAFAGRRL
jgi:hypothetical protein